MMKVKVGTTEWQQLLGRIKANDATLTQLSLSDNEIGDAGAQALALALKDNRTLTNPYP